MVKLNKRVEDHIAWMNGVYEEICERSCNEDVAKVIFKTVMFEENMKGG